MTHLAPISQRFIDNALDSGWFKNEESNWLLGFGKDLAGAKRFIDFFKDQKERSGKADCLLLGAYDGTEPIGFISFEYLGDRRKTSRIFIFFPPEILEKKELVFSLIDEALEGIFQLDFVLRVEIELLSINKPLISLLREFGFVQEGIKRSAYWMGVNGFNVVLLRKLRSEWKKQKKSGGD